MSQPTPVMRAFEAMGTRFECVLAAFDRAVHHTQGVAIAEEFEHLVRDWHRRLTVFEPASAVSMVNRLAASRPVSVDRDLFDLLDRCLAHTRQTRGTFDITVGSLMRAHGFRNTDNPQPAGPVGWGADRVHLDESASTVRFLSDGISLDLGGVAKGFVLDLARDELTGHGVTNAIIHGGTSSVIAVGSRPDGQPWRVRALTDDADAPMIDLVDSALSVSACAGRVTNGRGHIMDPSTGTPTSEAEAACVFGPSAEVCEVWSTALAVDPTLTESLPDGYGCHVRERASWRCTPAVPVFSSGSC